MFLLNSFIRSTDFIKKIYYLNLRLTLKRRGNHENINNKQIVGYIDWFIMSREQHGTDQ